MALVRSILGFIFFGFISAGCTSVQHISKTDITYVTINAVAVQESDESITQMIAPYKERLDGQMNEVLAGVAEEMTKKKPESTLGNWITDALLTAALQAGYQADLAIINYGGLRVNYLSAGPLTRGLLYELCPFDNLLVIVDVPGDLLDSLMQQIASADGWPVSAGVRMTIKDHAMTGCLVHKWPISSAKVYKVAMPDYVANGGDNMSILIPLPRIQTGLLIRDLLIAQAIATTSEGKPVTASIDGRIIIEQ